MCVFVCVRWMTGLLAAEEQDYASARGSADAAKLVIGDTGANSLEFACMNKGIETLPEAIEQTCWNSILTPWKREARTLVFVEEGTLEGANVPEDAGEGEHAVEAERVLPVPAAATEWTGMV